MVEITEEALVRRVRGLQRPREAEELLLLPSPPDIAGPLLTLCSSSQNTKAISVDALSD